MSYDQDVRLRVVLAGVTMSVASVACGNDIPTDDGISTCPDAAPLSPYLWNPSVSCSDYWARYRVGLRCSYLVPVCGEPKGTTMTTIECREYGLWMADESGPACDCMYGDKKTVDCNTCTCSTGSWICTDRSCADASTDAPADAPPDAPADATGQ